jgi:hypothetical protein
VADKDGHDIKGFFKLNSDIEQHKNELNYMMSFIERDKKKQKILCLNNDKNNNIIKIII